MKCFAFKCICERYKHILWIAITLFILTFDRVTKILVLKYLPFQEPVKIFSWFNLFFNYNTGAAFSFLNQPTTWQQWLFGGIAIIVSILLIFWLLRLPQTKVWLTVALALILGGTVGNLFDRVVYHYIIDFLDFYYKNWHWPTFNIADSAISIGAIMLMVDMFCKDKLLSKNS